MRSAFDSARNRSTYARPQGWVNTVRSMIDEVAYASPGR